MAMQANATMGATSYIYRSYLSSMVGRYLEDGRRSPIAFLLAQWDNLFSRLHNQAENEKTNKAISHPQARYCNDSCVHLSMNLAFEIPYKKLLITFCYMN